MFVAALIGAASWDDPFGGLSGDLGDEVVLAVVVQQSALIDLDEALLAEATAVLGTRTKKDTVHRALAEGRGHVSSDIRRTRL